LLRNN